MDYITIVAETLQKEKEFKIFTWNENKDLLLDIVPGPTRIDFKNRIIIGTFLNDLNQSELTSFLSDLVDYMNIVYIDFRNIVVMLYSQFESCLLYKINEKDKLSEFKRYKRQQGNRLSYLKTMYDFINTQIYEFSQEEKEVFNLVNGKLRAIRNDITHKPQGFFSIDEIKKQWDNNVSFEQNIILYHRKYKCYIDRLYFMADRFFKLCHNI